MTPFTSSKSQAPFFLTSALVSAAIGQAFIAQPDQPWTLVPGLAFYILALWLFTSSLTHFSVPLESKPLSPSKERILFFLIFVAAFGFRMYHIDSIPSGMHTDQGLMGQSALRVAFEGWRPFFEVLNYHVPEVTLYYLMGAWFKLAGSSYFTFHLFFVLFSLAAFPFIYLAFRQWAGPRVALLALFFLAVMRWHLIFSRNGFPTIQVPFYLFATLWFPDTVDCIPNPSRRITE